MTPDLRQYRFPLLAALGMTLALAIWILVSWQDVRDRTRDWRRQRAMDSFEMLNSVIDALQQGNSTDWKQIEAVFSTVFRGSRSRFAVVVVDGQRMVQTGNPPSTLDTAPGGELQTGGTYMYWAQLHPVPHPDQNRAATQAELHGSIYLGYTTSQTLSWFWERQAYVFLSAFICILAVTAWWIASIRRRILSNQLAAERTRIAHLEELGLAAAGLAHETKNPLGIIMGMAQQIADRPDIPADSRIMLEHIMDEVDKATSRLGNFMSFARPYKPQSGPTNVTALCREIAEILTPDFDAQGVTLRMNIPTVRILADAAMLRQILVNLLLNSLHASASGTAVDIQLIPRKRNYMLQVRDQGCGIGPELLPEIFKPYTTGSATGHGLGLPIVRRLVEAHGWRIQAVSAPGTGTTMTIYGLKACTESA